MYPRRCNDTIRRSRFIQSALSFTKELVFPFSYRSVALSRLRSLYVLSNFSSQQTDHKTYDDSQALLHPSAHVPKQSEGT
jgi:hypothetical protein